MYQVGLTGGIASGKSTVSTLLAARGAVVIDADRIAREVVEPGTPALAEIEQEYGERVIAADGTLDRTALAEIVFNDPEANSRLRAITYPEIGRVIGERIDAQKDTDNIVLLDAALLVESGWQGLGTLLVVAADSDLQVERMLRDRDMTEDEARARMRMQAPVEEKIVKADIVIWNNGDFDALEQRIDDVWRELQVRAAAAEGAEPGGARPAAAEASDESRAPAASGADAGGSGATPDVGRTEVEQAFRNYLRVQQSLEWDRFCDLFTEDAVYVEHHFGTFRGREAIREWLVPIMAPLNESGWTYPTDWWVIDGPRVVFRWRNRLPNPDGRDAPYEFPGVTVLEYAGDGMWSFEEDFYNFVECERVMREYAEAAARAGA